MYIIVYLIIAADCKDLIKCKYSGQAVPESWLHFVSVKHRARYVELLVLVSVRS